MRSLSPSVLVAALALTAVGCGGGKKVTLTGSVKVKGQPLAAGSVMVQCADGSTASGTAENGAYSVEGVSAGVVKIAVVEAAAAAPGANRPGAADRGGAGGPGGRGVPAAAPQPAPPKPPAKIPPEYQKLDTTPITHDTSAGTVKDIDIP